MIVEISTGTQEVLDGFTVNIENLIQCTETLHWSLNTYSLRLSMRQKWSRREQRMQAHGSEIEDREVRQVSAWESRFHEKFPHIRSGGKILSQAKLEIILTSSDFVIVISSI